MTVTLDIDTSFERQDQQRRVERSGLWCMDCAWASLRRKVPSASGRSSSRGVRRPAPARDARRST